MSEESTISLLGTNSGSSKCSADAHVIDEDNIVVTTAMAAASRNNITERLAMVRSCCCVPEHEH